MASPAQRFEFAVVEEAVVVAVVLAVVVVDEEMVAGEENPDFAGEVSMPS